MVRSAWLLFVLFPLAQAQDPPPHPRELAEALEKKFLALGPIRAELVSGITPDRAVRIVLHLDLPGRRVCFEIRAEGPKANLPPFRSISSPDFIRGVTEADFLSIRRDCGPIYDALDRAYYDLQGREGTLPDFPRILAPLFSITIQERMEPRGAMAWRMGFGRKGGPSWLLELAGASEPPTYDKAAGSWILKGKRGRRTCIDAETGMLRWIEIQHEGAPVRCLELKEFKTGVPVPDVEPSGLTITSSLSVQEIAGIFRTSTMESLWAEWDRRKKDLGDARTNEIAVRFVASMADMMDTGWIRSQAQSFMIKECPDDGSWFAGSEGMLAARARFAKSVEENAGGREERVRADLEKWRDALLGPFEDGEEPDERAKAFLKAGFDKAALKAERARRPALDPAALFAIEEAMVPPLVHFNRGTDALQAGDAKRAESQLTITLRLWPRCAEAYLNRGSAQVRLKNLDRAIEDYDRALELKPEVKGGFAARGQAWSLKGDFAKAIADLTRAVETDPKDRRPWIQRAWCHENLKDYASAAEDYTKALDLNDEDAPILTKRGYARWSIKKLQLAREDFTKAIEIDPKNPEALFLRATLDQSKNRESALADVTKALEHAPKDWGYRKEAEELKTELEKKE